MLRLLKMRKVTSCYSNRSDNPHRRRHINQFIVLVWWRQCAFTSNTSFLGCMSVCSPKIYRLVRPLLHGYRHFIPQMSYAIQCFSMGQKCSFYRGSGPQSIDCFLNPHGPHPKLVQIWLNRFCKACVHDQRQRDSQTTLPHEVCRNSPRLSSVLQATRAINKSTFTNHLTYLLTYLKRTRVKPHANVKTINQL